MFSSPSLYRISSYRSGLYDCGVRVICIHGRTRGSTKHRRVGAADLATIGRISADLEIYHHQSQHNQIQIGPPLVWDHQVVVIANGNITSPGDLLRNTKILQESCGSDVTIDSTALPRPVGGFMSAEGILKDPAIFYRYQQLLQESSTVTFAATPSLFELFAEYCKISDLYYSLNGWNGFNLLEGKKYFPHTICPCDHNNSASQEYENRHEEKNLRVARQHLNWMLGKSGHGRLIRYEYLAKAFRRHTDQMDAINGCTNIQELLQIAESAFLSKSLEA
jgi:tRNA-dihydrouridine synthase